VARGTPVKGIYPNMKVALAVHGDHLVETFHVSQEWQRYSTKALKVSSTVSGSISVYFTNDACIEGEDRNLFIREILIRRASDEMGEEH